jgi:carbon monoxide dehydrogenase subunit G
MRNPPESAWRFLTQAAPTRFRPVLQRRRPHRYSITADRENDRAVAMDMTGEHRIGLPQDLVWRALNDPDILKASIPGCEELVREGDTGFKGRIAASVGPVRAKFSGTATLTDIDPPNGYTLTGNGSGGPAGMVKGGAKVQLSADAEGTLLRYEAQAQVAGKLAQIGSRLVDMAAKKMADEFFQNFVQQIQPIALAEAPMPLPEAAVPFPEPAGEASGAQTAPAQPEATTQPEATAQPEAAAQLAAATQPATSPPAPREPHSIGRPSWLVWGPIVLIVIIVIAFLLGVL